MDLLKIASSKMAPARKMDDDPIRILPEDILIEIFFCCNPIVNHYEVDWANNDMLDTLYPRNHPWNLSHVSHRWREIALSLPRLWSVIYLEFTRYTPDYTQQDYFLASLLFKRSARLDLCVNIASGEMDIGDHPLMPFLKESTTRWRSLYAHMSSRSLQSLSGCKFPLLQELGVRDEVPDDGIDVPVDTFRDVQNISILDIYPSYDSDVEGYETLGEFPWSKLSKLSCHSFTIKADFLPGLRQSSSLEELTITVDYIDSSFWMELAGSVISFPAVKRLEVTNCAGEEDNVMKFVHILHIPSIRCLSVTFAAHLPLKYSARIPHPDFHRVLSLYVTCSMTGLSSQPYKGGARTLIKFLTSMSGVEVFRLQDRCVTPQFLESLVVADKGAVLLPSLTTLDFHECGFFRHIESLKLILRIVESRSLNRPLQRIVLPQEDWLNELVLDGVVVTRLYRSYVSED